MFHALCSHWDLHCSLLLIRYLWGSNRLAPPPPPPLFCESLFHGPRSVEYFFTPPPPHFYLDNIICKKKCSTFLNVICFSWPILSEFVICRKKMFYALCSLNGLFNCYYAIAMYLFYSYILFILKVFMLNCTFTLTYVYHFYTIIV